MRATATRLILAICLAAIAAPAAAREWVTLYYRLGEGGHWIDRTSIRRAGDLVYFDATPWLARGDYPDETTPATTQAYDCRTRKLYTVRDGAAADEAELPRDRVVAYDAVLCASGA